MALTFWHSSAKMLNCGVQHLCKASGDGVPLLGASSVLLLPSRMPPSSAVFTALRWLSLISMTCAASNWVTQILVEPWKSWLLRLTSRVLPSSQASQKEQGPLTLSAG